MQTSRVTCPLPRSSAKLSKLKIRTAAVFMPLLQPARYKGAHGGRGSGKSHFFAELGIEDALRFPGDHGEGLRWACVREVQKSLKDSAKFLIEKKLSDFGLGEQQGFKVFRQVIETPGDGSSHSTGCRIIRQTASNQKKDFTVSGWKKATASATGA